MRSTGTSVIRDRRANRALSDGPDPQRTRSGIQTLLPYVQRHITSGWRLLYGQALGRRGGDVRVDLRLRRPDLSLEQEHCKSSASSRIGREFVDAHTRRAIVPGHFSLARLPVRQRLSRCHSALHQPSTGKYERGWSCRDGLNSRPSVRTTVAMASRSAVVNPL